MGATGGNVGGKVFVDCRVGEEGQSGEEIYFNGFKPSRFRRKKCSRVEVQNDTACH